MAVRTLRSRGEVALSYPSEDELLSPETLAELEAWAQVSGWSRHHVRAVERYWRALGEPRPFRILDVGCALGGLLADLHAWGARQEVSLDLVGVDTHADLVARARERLGSTAAVHRIDDLTHLGGPPDAFHLATVTLVINQLLPPDRLRLVAELGRVARTAYVFDVTPSVEGEVGSRLLPLLASLGAAPPEAWVRTLERAPSVDELVRLLAPLPVQVARVFPAAVCTGPEPRQRARAPRPTPEPVTVRFETPDGVPGAVGSERAE